MSIVENFGKTTMPTVLKDPFSKTKITSVWVDYSPSLFSPYNWSASGSVSFKNGDTKGEQKFKGESFDEVVAKIKAFIETELKQD
jgi:hypothetical protein